MANELEILVRANNTAYGRGDEADLAYHVTQVPGAFVTFTFNGAYVAYYSHLNMDHGEFDVYLDERLVFRGSSYGPLTHSCRLFSSDVKPGFHTLKVTNDIANATVSGAEFFIYRQSASTTLSHPEPPPPPSGSSTPGTPQTGIVHDAQPPKSASRSNVPSVIAGVLGAVLLLALLLLAFVLRRRRGQPTVVPFVRHPASTELPVSPPRAEKTLSGIYRSREKPRGGQQSS
ncbi:hypothetical protein AURDEDRAFT_170669 [Auricularia subglabra TFB-10046 SS5]|nr:hypothetical protein AURDEDRAFT_170669 [Auricularia subglabra TFB-10046 SS5]